LDIRAQHDKASMINNDGQSGLRCEMALSPMWSSRLGDEMYISYLR